MIIRIWRDCVEVDYEGRFCYVSFFSTDLWLWHFRTILLAETKTHLYNFFFASYWCYMTVLMPYDWYDKLAAKEYNINL